MATVKQLQIEARKLGIKGFGKLSKVELEHKIASTRKYIAKTTPKTVEEASARYAQLTKGEARKLRKKLRAKGRTDLAAASPLFSSLAETNREGTTTMNATKINKDVVGAIWPAGKRGDGSAGWWVLRVSSDLLKEFANEGSAKAYATSHKIGTK